MPVLRPVILSGGSGTRLWPLSTPEVPKQFAHLFDDRSLFAMTLARLDGVDGIGEPIVVTGARHLELVQSEISRLEADARAIIVEPIGRNTAPAALAAALVADPGDVLVILPSDHLITDVVGFQTAVQAAAGMAADLGIVTFGIRPTRPETGFGYIEVGESVGDGYTVARFKEKPDLAEAEEMLADGRHLWNSGMFVARADYLLTEGAHYVPQILDGVSKSLPAEHKGTIELGVEFSDVESISFDHGLMEKTNSALVVPIDVGWSDVGSYESLLDVSTRDSAGNHVSGNVTLDAVSGSIVMATSRRVVVAGLVAFVVIETQDAVLVLPLDRAQDVNEINQKGPG